jgi:hypothetical protein
MTERNDEMATGTAGDGSDDRDATGGSGDGAGVPPAVAPAAMGSGGGTPLAVPGVLAGTRDAEGEVGGGSADPDEEAFRSGEDEVGGSGGPAGGTARP